jgi:hypothetical protein
MKDSKDIRPLDRTGPPEYEAGVLTTSFTFKGPLVCLYGFLP